MDNDAQLFGFADSPSEKAAGYKMKSRRTALLVSCNAMIGEQ
jgi:hypothetical protein